MPYKDKEKQREYVRQWMRKRRAAWFADKTCTDCGTTEQLEIDHVDPSLKKTNSVWSWRVERRDEELAKCVVRCFLCHLKRHAPAHGTQSRWNSKRWRCRCSPCKAAHNKVTREHARRKRARDKGAAAFGRS